MASRSLGSALCAVLFALLVYPNTGCRSSQLGPSERVLIGAWGGDHVSLTVAATGSRVEFDCAHGEIPGELRADATGTFSGRGTFVREHGGPIRLDEVPDSHPAIYAGTVMGASMQLAARLTDTNEVIGTFMLMRGAPGRVLKCL